MKTTSPCQVGSWEVEQLFLRSGASGREGELHPKKVDEHDLHVVFFHLAGDTLFLWGGSTWIGGI